MKRIALSLLLMVGLALVLTACAGRTDPATRITATSATLNATVSLKPKDQGGEYWFEWSSNDGSSWTEGTHHKWGSQDCSFDGSGKEGKPFAIKEDVTGLTPNTTYAYRIAGRACDGPVAYVKSAEFTTQLNVAQPTMTAPKSADSSSARFQLQAQSTGGLASASFEYRKTDADPWTQIPLPDVSTGAEQLSAWPAALNSSGQTPLLTWNAWKTIGAETPVQIRARFNDGSGGWVASNVVEVSLSRSSPNANDAIAAIGPGQVDLVTGNFSLTSQDVSITTPTSALTATRSYVSRNKNASGPLGPGWNLSLPVPSAASDYTGISGPGAQGPRAPTALADDPSGGYRPWSSVGNAAASDDTYARASVDTGNPSHYLRATGLGLHVPANMTITGVRVDIEHKSDDERYGPLAADASVELVKGGTVMGADHARRNTTWSPEDEVFRYGGENDTWGVSLTPADVNAPGFGAAIAAYSIRMFATAYIDQIRVTVFYSPPGSDGSVVLSQTAGTQSHFKHNADGSFTLESGLAKVTLTKEDSNYILDDNLGDRTTFSSPTDDDKFVPVKTEQPGSTQQTTLKWEVVSGTARVTRVLAPPPTGVSCGDQLNPGCRALTFDYATSTTATGTPQAAWGDYAGRLRQINLVAYDPSKSAMQPVAVQQYSYDNGGRLRAAWDPRISPALKTAYAYDSNGVLGQMTPPGLAPWSFQYATTADDPGLGRLKSVSRAASGLPTETTTMAYRVPLSGGSAPYQMTPHDVSAWGQQDDPTDATAIFPPDHVPSNPPGSFDSASVYYMNAKGQEVNLAAAGGRIATTEHDANGQVVRELDPANRARALQGSDSTARSQRLDTERTYSPDGVRLLGTLKPQHTVKLDSGETVQARQKTVMSYDEGSPGGATFNLLTTSTEGAFVPSSGALADQRTTSYRYDGEGWDVRRPTQTIVDPGGLAVTKRAGYDPSTALQTIETRPALARANGGAGQSVGALITRFDRYTAGGGGQCAGKPWLADLLCARGPVSQPTLGLPPVPSSTFDYNVLDQPTTTTDTADASTRTKTTSYDSAGRVTRTAVSGPGAATPTVSLSYDPGTGVMKTGSATIDGSARTLTRGYDAYGRQTSYRDADGVTTTTSYDALDRPVSTSDGKGTQTQTYDALTGDLTSVNLSGVGQFTGTYDGSGRLVSERLPDGVKATTSYDDSGAEVGLSYDDCSGSCRSLLSFSTTKSIHDQIATQTSSGWSGGTRKQAFTYDRAGRLTDTTDESGGKCTRHAYEYDADSNRTGMLTGNNPDGSCEWKDPPRKVSSYDEADRVADAGYQYDALGRTLTVPGKDAGGSDLTATYYANDRDRTITQAGKTTTFGLDPLMRPRLRSTSGSADEVQHYSNDEATPSWTETPSSGSWTRLGGGLSGQMEATQKGNAGGPTSTVFALNDMQGSVVATVNAAGAPQLQQASRYDEFGVPMTGPATDRYGWLGGHKVSTAASTGAIAMGARLYLPTTGRFLQTDPVPGGSANAYDYVNQDPMDGLDLSGEYYNGPRNTNMTKQCRLNAAKTQLTCHYEWLHLARRVKKQCSTENVCGPLGCVYTKHVHVRRMEKTCTQDLNYYSADPQNDAPKWYHRRCETSVGAAWWLPGPPPQPEFQPTSG